MTARSSNCSVLSKFFPMLVKKPSFGGVINPKTNLNHELGSKFFSLSDLAYKLVNPLVFEKCSWKNFTYEFEVCYTYIALNPIRGGSDPLWKISKTNLLFLWPPYQWAVLGLQCIVCSMLCPADTVCSEKGCHFG